VSRTDAPGQVALVGSGEFLEVMVPVDAELLAGRPQRAVFLPTASAEEGPERVRYWIDLGSAHYRAMGVEPVPLLVLERDDAEDPELAARVAGAGLVYLSGGNPGYLAHTLAGTAVWRAIIGAWRAGAALAGCSAGACALSRIADDFRRPGRYSGAGLAVVPQLVVIPHFDRFEDWRPGLADQMLARTPPDAVLVGIDEETALVGDGDSFTVRGRKSVWRIERDGTRSQFMADEQAKLAVTAPQ
jgi:cyanophycinase-like exopeptidase